MVDEEVRAERGVLDLNLEAEVDRPVVRLQVVAGPRNHRSRVDKPRPATLATQAKSPRCILHNTKLSSEPVVAP
jgi:hypothetical protein